MSIPRKAALAVATLLLAIAAHAQPAEIPTQWWVNCNGYTGELVFEVDARTDRVTGTLLGTPVEGYLVGRHIVLHRYPQGRTQIWEGWISNPAGDARGEPYFSDDRTVAGTCSESRGGNDSVNPWFGIEAGGTAGVPGLGTPATDTEPLTGLAKEVTGTLHGLRWEMPCATEGQVCSAAELRPSHSTRLGGDPGHLYEVTLRFRGVVEYHSYAGGQQDGLWYIGGQSAQSSYNVYKMEVSDPQQTFFLNADRAGLGRTWAIDYTRTIQMRGGALVTLSADAQDGALINNHDGQGQAIVVPGVPPAPAPYNGQFIQMDVVSVRSLTRR